MVEKIKQKKYNTDIYKELEREISSFIKFLCFFPLQIYSLTKLQRYIHPHLFQYFFNF